MQGVLVYGDRSGASSTRTAPVRFTSPVITAEVGTRGARSSSRIRATSSYPAKLIPNPKTPSAKAKSHPKARPKKPVRSRRCDEISVVSWFVIRGRLCERHHARDGVAGLFFPLVGRPRGVISPARTVRSLTLARERADAGFV